MGRQKAEMKKLHRKKVKSRKAQEKSRRKAAVEGKKKK